MIDRCTNPDNASYKDYGARGIAVCDRWLLLENFVADMGLRPQDKTIDRIDPDGNYEPSNCRWSTSVEQQRNRRNVKLSTGRAAEARLRASCGEQLKELAREMGVHPSVMSRAVRGETWG
jgi:hypothetical protein